MFLFTTCVVWLLAHKEKQHNTKNEQCVLVKKAVASIGAKFVKQEALCNRRRLCNDIADICFSSWHSYQTPFWNMKYSIITSIFPVTAVSNSKMRMMTMIRWRSIPNHPSLMILILPNCLKTTIMHPW